MGTRVTLLIIQTFYLFILNRIGWSVFIYNKDYLTAYSPMVILEGKPLWKYC